MTRKKKPDPVFDASHPHPDRGGAWVRQADGSLVRDPSEDQRDPDAEPEAEAPLRLPPLTDHQEG